ncbi:MAG: ferrous iron transport protein A [Eubacteriales bacterium]|nr:ferrous iron transport protein A [Eubacteriales bacterium]
MKTLKNIEVGETVVVDGILGTGPLRRRFLDMGITKGAKIQLKKVAPLGDPMEFSIRGYLLTIRKADADRIFVKEGEVKYEN